MNDQAESLRRLVRAQRDWERMTTAPTSPRIDADREAPGLRDASGRAGWLSGQAPRGGRGTPRNPG